MLISTVISNVLQRNCLCIYLSAVSAEFRKANVKKSAYPMATNNRFKNEPRATIFFRESGDLE